MGFYSRPPDGAILAPDLLRVLHEHRRYPADSIRPFRWRSGGFTSIYDYELPRRKGIPYEERLKWAEDTWTLHSFVCNIPIDQMRWIATIETATGIFRPSYREVVKQCLRDGCIRPSSYLDRLLNEDSSRLCPPEMRIQYVDFVHSS